MADKNVPYVILTFNDDGTVAKEAVGFKGKTCVEQTKFIDEALGGEVRDRKFKVEYNDGFFGGGYTNAQHTA
jgi:hypothetical protein